MSELVVDSKDGTIISTARYGAGRALVIVSGALFSSRLWQRVLPLLTANRTVYVIDRRGRGKSGNQPSYAPERELEDLQAVLAAIPGPVDLFGHSSGAILALQLAAIGASNLERLVVYEPPVFFTDVDRIAQDLPERLDALIESGQSELAVATFLREGPRASETELESMKAGSGWTQMVQHLAHTVAYDARVQRSFDRNVDALTEVRIPTLMLVGSQSPVRMRHAAERVASLLPNARLRELAGQRHIAMLLGPALFASALDEFLT